jgi:hypothetical protein
MKQNADRALRIHTWGRSKYQNISRLTYKFSAMAEDFDNLLGPRPAFVTQQAYFDRDTN